MSENGSRPKFPGVEIQLGEKVYVLPSLSVGQAKTLWPKILNLNSGVTAENLHEKYDDIVETIRAALSRNYPDITAEELMDVIDMGNIRYLQQAIMGQSGLTPPPGLVPVAKVAAQTK